MKLEFIFGNICVSTSYREHRESVISFRESHSGGPRF